VSNNPQEPVILRILLHGGEIQIVTVRESAVKHMTDWHQKRLPELFGSMVDPMPWMIKSADVGSMQVCNIPQGSSTTPPQQSQGFGNVWKRSGN